VSTKPKTAPASNESLAQLSYEEALERLEKTVEAMEGGDLPLEKLIGHYEEGMRLRQRCLEKLAEAEVKIKALEESIEGDFALKPLTLDDESE
tara:strand:- start:653 stop:931 length:279 start_codon:yes stop_codon:yes gene_type:complete